MSQPSPSNVPFRWDLVTPDQLGLLLADTSQPDLWFMKSLVGATGKVVARSGGGDLIFVGRSLDSMFDLLGGALPRTDDVPGVFRLPLSFQRPQVQSRAGQWGTRPLDVAERMQVRRLLASLDVTPYLLARRSRPVAFVDVVDQGSTFTELFALLRDWIDEEREAWNTIRRKVRFVGVTSRTKTSPNTFRWQQHAEWTRELPAKSVLNVSLDLHAWSYVANSQVKLTRSFRPEDWLAEPRGPGRDEKTRQALAEAAAVVAYGRSREGRRALARAFEKEPAVAQPWLRSLAHRLNNEA